MWALPTPGGPDLSAAPFTSIVQTHEEWAAEYANKTMHGTMHMGWAPDAVGVTVTPASAPAAYG
ncbi:hypothetical protein [Streptomyces sp. NPDC055243]|uniref:hypothetical protein n=1 Tax=Streptomyces sp. NPDC055243 TaxID=3365720 RepID=UPI0037D0FD6F